MEKKNQELSQKQERQEQEPKKYEALDKVEKQLNAVPIEKRKLYFFLFFGALVAFIIIKLILTLSLPNSSSEIKEDAKVKMTIEDMKNIPIYVSDTLSKDQLELLDSIK